NEDGQDPYIPLLCWWAVEHHAVAALDHAVETFTSPRAWQTAMIRDVILGRLIRRYAAEGTEMSYAACARIVAATPASERSRMLDELDQGLQDRPGVGPSAGTMCNAFAGVETENTKDSKGV